MQHSYAKLVPNYGVVGTITYVIARRALLWSAKRILVVFTRPLRQFFKSWGKLMLLLLQKIPITCTLHATILNAFLITKTFKIVIVKCCRLRHATSPLALRLRVTYLVMKRRSVFFPVAIPRLWFKTCFGRMEAISESAYEILKNKFSYIYNALKDHPNCRSENLLKQFDQHNKELIILGFYNGQYNLNLIKPFILKQLLNKTDFLIKIANTYLCLKTESYGFLTSRII